MSSKSVLILGIVFIFLLNVVAVHNYIDSYYYQSEDTNLTKIKLTPEAIVLENLSDKDKKEEIKTKITIVKQKKVVKEEVKKHSDIDEELIRYKSHYKNELEQEKKSLSKLFETKKEQEKKLHNEVKKTQKEPIEDALITLELSIKDEFIPHNPIIKKISQRLDRGKIIKIKIYKYSIKLKDYLEKIKYDFAENGVDVDDIRVIYNKDESKKDKIKILLVKKD